MNKKTTKNTTLKTKIFIYGWSEDARPLFLSTAYKLYTVLVFSKQKSRISKTSRRSNFSPIVADKLVSNQSETSEISWVV